MENEKPQFYSRRFRTPSQDHQKLIDEVRRILKHHGYSIAAVSNEFDRMSVDALQEIVRSWALWDERKAYMHV